MSKHCRLLMIFVMLSGLLLGSVAWAENSGTVTVRVSNLRNRKGQMAILLFKSANGFPRPNGDNTIGVLTKRISPALEGEVCFTDVPYGEYAVSVLHDENNNNTMDFDEQNMPAEGAATSDNNGSFDYEPSKFTLETDEKVIEIRMQYPSSSL